MKWLLFFSSYIPLYVILTAKHWGFQVTIPQIGLPIISSVAGASVPILSLGWALLTIVSYGALKMLFELRRSKGGQDFKQVYSYESRDDLITNYILVYIFPFVVLNFNQLSNWIAFVILFFVIGLIQVRSNQLYVNPVLAVSGYEIYEVDTETGKVTLVTKESLEQGTESVRTVELSNGVHMCV